MSNLVIQKAAFRKEPGTILKSPNSNMELALKRIVEKSSSNAENLALILQKISNKKNLQRSDLKKAAKNIGKYDKDLGKTLEGISTVAENAQNDEEYAGMTIGQIVGEIVGFLKDATGSIVKFNDIWAKAIDTTFEVNINTAVAETSKMQWEAGASIAGGAITAIGGMAMVGGGILDGALSIEQAVAIKGCKVMDKAFAGLVGEDGEITATTEEVSGVNKNIVEGSQNAVPANETEDLGKNLTPAEKRALPQERKRAMIKNLHAERKYENEKVMENAIAEIKRKREGFMKMARGLTQGGQPLGQGGGQGVSGLCQIQVSNYTAIAGKSRATGGVMESEKQRKSQLYNNTVKIFQGTSELSNQINAFIRSNVPA